LFTRFKHKSSVLFLDPQSEIDGLYEKGQKVDILLSPSLYWVKKMTLPVSSIREVKKLLPSIFEDSLPESHYSYTAYKSGDAFMLFAYEDKKILDMLSAKGIASADISSIHFAQSEFDTFEGAVEINETQSMYVKDEIVVVVPTEWLAESSRLETHNIKLSKHTIKLQQFGHIVDNSSLYKIGIILGILIVVVMVEIFMTNAKLNTINDAKDEIFSKYKLQATMIQNRSTMSKYSKIHLQQTKLREYIADFLTMPLKKNQKITHISYKNGLLSVKIKGVKKNEVKRLFTKFDAKKVKYKLSYEGESIRVEMKL